jgi:hypothetical protein
LYETVTMVQFPKWVQGIPLTNVEMLVAGGVLLVFAGFLIGVRRRSRIALQNSAVTEELIAYLARIANALETSRPPSADEISAQVVKRVAEMAEAKPNGRVREMPFSIFGREYKPEG